MKTTRPPTFGSIACAMIAAFVFAPCTFAFADPNLTDANPPADAIWLDTLPLATMTSGWQVPLARRSVAGSPLSIGGISFTHGVGTHAESAYTLDLHSSATRFQSEVGVDDDTAGKGSVVFKVLVDGNTKVTTAPIKGGDKPTFIDVDLTGAKILQLIASPAADSIAFDHADWAGATIILLPVGTPPTPYVAPVDPGRLTIPTDNPAPAIHYPKITGATPGRPFLFLIPATGIAPLQYSSVGLPAGLKLNSATGVISGSLVAAGTTTVHLTVKNQLGTAHSVLTIVGGDHKLALTPPMGWNSWNVWAGAVDQSKVKAAADVLIAQGLTGHGYEYVNIDDTWEGSRNSNGDIQSNSKFPDMRALTAYVHAKGLKVGIYSSPGPATCAGYPASYRHEMQDARTYAEWGFDYLKYDWCSYSNIVQNPDLAGFQKPYIVMRTALDDLNRDIVYSLCQYGWGDVWNWGADPQIRGNTWRTHNDIDDLWHEPWSSGDRGVSDIIESMIGLSAHAGPGHWNDPDMLMVGIVGFGNTHPTRLTPNEQITHISLWCMFSSPLLIGCDLTRLDPFTKALLTNDEAIAIDQDELGQPASLYTTTPGGGEIWVRPLEDKSKAVALLNTNNSPLDMTVIAAELRVSDTSRVRDLWLHKSVGTLGGGYTVTVPAHGTVLLKVIP
jgi:alpha-galactosidase